MKVKDENPTAGLDRLNVMFAWWGLPSASSGDPIDRHMKRFQAFLSDLQKAYGEAYNIQMGALLSANERIADALQEFLRCRQPQDVIVAESDVVATILEGASLQARAWAELAQKVQECCAAMARVAADDIREETTEGAGVKTPVKVAPSRARETEEQPAHA